jgi:metal-sulfur cluster biosynthetic enzyme
MSELSIEERIDELMIALRDVVDPELGLNVVELGLIREVNIEDASGHIIMILTTPFCPYAAAMINQVKMTAEKSLGTPTMVEMGTEMWSPSLMEDGAGADWGIF